MQDLPDYFREIADPRGASNAQRHLLMDILMVALCAVLSGAQGFVEIEEFGLEKQKWLRERLGLKLPNGIPSHDTFGRVFAALCPDAFSGAMQRWTQALYEKTQGEVIAIDGKTLRRSFDSATGKAALHVVNAWANSARLMLAACPVEGKSNEITAAPSLLALLDVRGCIVTCDALNTQKGLARQIIQQGADYVLALKDNHALLCAEVRDYFAWCQQQPGGLVKMCDATAWQKGWEHGRQEVRRVFVIAATEPDWSHAREQWPGLQSLVMLETQRRQGTGTGTAGLEHRLEQRFYLSSLAPEASTLLQAVRSHWGVENSGHWCLDVAFDEDRNRVRKENAPFNYAVLNRLALNLLRTEPTGKKGLKARRLRAALSDDYRLRLLCAAKS